MKFTFIISFIVLLSLAQIIVYPNTQACQCKDMLTEDDCVSKQGCQWERVLKYDSMTKSIIPSKTERTCISSIISLLVPTPSAYCGSVVRYQDCSSTKGCAFINQICTIFSGCSAYVYKTNAACQSISKQCTTDGSRCVNPTSCQKYLTQGLCIGNVATSGAKSCLWKTIGDTETCVDKVCSDAPKTFKTQEQCQNWIEGCFSNGIGCTTTQEDCSTYKQINGCNGMIGFDGPCSADTINKSKMCRNLECTDAPLTHSTNKLCQKFLKGCVTNGKGCEQFLKLCNTYTQTKGCTGLLGFDGPCTKDKAKGVTMCRSLACSDAPASLITNEGCSRFLFGCITTGYGCDSSLKLCSLYKGTTTSCFKYLGSDGYCKGSSDSEAFCSVRLCSDASSTNKTDADCNSFQYGCITTGAGCTQILNSCKSYKGTSITCSQYIGNDGNCTAPEDQLKEEFCVAKLCRDASITKTNAACKSFSYQCVTDGFQCIEPQICEETSNELLCQGNQACVYNQICLNRSSCNNFNSQLLCELNQQQYLSGGIIYLRSCLWSVFNNTCSNLLCSNLSSILTTDALCSEALSGCLTNGAGCIDVSDPCTSYSGKISYCYEQRGINGSQLCTQLYTVSDSTVQCIARKLCSEAKTYSLIIQTSDDSCNAYLPNCFYDGMGNCTNKDCTTYFGTQTYCGAITTARIGSKISICWKTINLTDAQTPCEVKYCNQASPAQNYLTDDQCNGFFTNCQHNLGAAGGCSPPSIQCYSNLQLYSTCTYIQNKFCQKKIEICRILDCKNVILPSTAITPFQKGVYYQGFKDQNGYNCLFEKKVINNTISCTSFVTVGMDRAEKLKYCQGMIYPGNNSCGYSTGDICAQAVCDQFLAIGGTDDLRATYCQSLRVDGIIFCGLALPNYYCHNRKCNDYGIQTKTDCLNYTKSCRWNDQVQLCYGIESYCGNNFIPDIFKSTEILKAQFCYGIESTNVVTKFCDYELDFSDYVCCQSRTSCNQIHFPVSVESDLDKAKFCVFQKQLQGYQCGYISLSQTKSNTCVDANLCQNYVLNQTTDIAKKVFCQTQKNKSQQNCCFTSTSPLVCSENNNECSNYDTYGATLSENQSYCSEIVLKDTITCASITAGVSKCKYPICSDVSMGQSFQTCKAYNKICTFDGSVCVQVAKTCDQYIALIIGQQIGCAGLTSEDNTKCGWTILCVIKNDEANLIACKDYAQGCQYNGIACVDNAKSCISYLQFQGLTDQTKAIICNQIINVDGKRCTYMVGSISCIDTKLACDYILPANTDDFNRLACSLIQNQDGIQCQFINGDSRCSTPLCQQELIDLLNSDCNPYFTECQTGYTGCTTRICNISPLYRSQKECTAFREGCLSKGLGCVEPTDDCSYYQGTQSTCQTYIGNGLLCTNTINALATQSCISKNCNQNQTALNDNDCAQWYPSVLKDNCVWGGTLGCVSPQPCSSFIGTVDSCPIFTATDGPCFGTSSAASLTACTSNTSFCQGAPKRFSTDAQCKTWGSTCMTNGQGCISIAGAQCSNIIAPLACNIYNSTVGLYCDLANQCKTKSSTCDVILTASECNNIPLVGDSIIKCGWDSQLVACIPLNCSQLPITLTTDSECSAFISSCTTNGAGCVTKGACSSYSKLACIPAATTDVQKYCIWLNSECRPIQCTDNKDATSDIACNAFLSGCKTSGKGCFQNLICSNFISYALCLIDSNGYPCLWYKISADSPGLCINYENCTYIISSSHSECQALSSLCTTNGVNCIAITACSLTVSQESCIIGTDGTCGWLPEIGVIKASCQLYTNCQDALGKTLDQCQQWGHDCISDGNNCIQGQNCQNYQTQIACENHIYGLCVWNPLIARCRVQICSDAPINFKTHKQCVTFPASTACTALNSTCMAQSKCSGYNIVADCVHGTDGFCMWYDDYCYYKVCDYFQESQCQTNKEYNCVFVEGKCITQQRCSYYDYKGYCQYGTDGPCVYTPDSYSSNYTGICALFTICTQADFDQKACLSRQDACQYYRFDDNGTIKTQCLPHSCASKAIGSTCQPVPSWDLSSYQICIQNGSSCEPGSPSSFTSQNCFNNSVGTYYWSFNTQSCIACKTQALDIIKSSHLVNILIVITFMI